MKEDFSVISPKLRGGPMGLGKLFTIIDGARFPRTIVGEIFSSPVRDIEDTGNRLYFFNRSLPIYKIR